MLVASPAKAQGHSLLEGASGPFSPGESAVFPPKEVFVKAVHIALRPACDRSSVFSMS